MGSLSVWHWLIFLVVALLLFGGSGKISSIMGDVAKGIKSFKRGMTEDDTPAPSPAPVQPAADPFKREEPRAISGTAGQATAGASGPAQATAGSQQAHANKAS